MVKNLPTMQETWIRSLHWEDPLEKGMATHSSILAWKIPWTKEPGGLQGRKESDMTVSVARTRSRVHTHTHTHTHLCNTDITKAGDWLILFITISLPLAFPVWLRR